MSRKRDSGGLKLALEVLRPWRLRLAGLNLLGLPQVGLGVFLAWAVGYGVDRFLAQAGGLQALIPIFLIGLFLVRSGYGVFVQYLSLGLGSRIHLALERRTFAKLLKIPLLDAVGAGEAANSLFYDCDLYAHGVVELYGTLIISLLQAAGLWVYLLVLDWRLAAVVAAAVPIFLLPLQFLLRRMRRASSDFYAENQEYWSRSVDATRAPRLVRGTGAQGSEFRAFADSGERRRRGMLRQAKFHFLAGPLGEIFAACAIGAAFWLGVDLLGAQGLSLGGLGSAAVATVWLLGAIKGIIDAAGGAQGTLAMQDRLVKLWRTADEILDGPEPPEWRVLEARGLAFSYPDGADVFQGVDIGLRRGEFIHLAGPSGAGKTTLARVLCRLYEPTGGRLLLDGKPLSDYGLGPWRLKTALVDQEPEFLPGTLEEAVAYPDEVGDAEIGGLLREVGLGDFDRELTSGAPELSGGERRRLALARALYHRPELLILDETTSYVDAELERKLIEVVRRRLPGAAVLVISHRERVGALADRRLRLDAGGMAEL
ncbi:MAG TPA: ABC transporter ATP-binding protein [bacterium]|nr:ABC transporter ATP-binding protein [bacterium]